MLTLLLHPSGWHQHQSIDHICTTSLLDPPGESWELNFGKIGLELVSFAHIVPILRVGRKNKRER